MNNNNNNSDDESLPNVDTSIERCACCDFGSVKWRGKSYGRKPLKPTNQLRPMAKEFSDSIFAQNYSGLTSYPIVHSRFWSSVRIYQITYGNIAVTFLRFLSVTHDLYVRLFSFSVTFANALNQNVVHFSVSIHSSVYYEGKSIMS